MLVSPFFIPTFSLYNVTFVFPIRLICVNGTQRIQNNRSSTPCQAVELCTEVDRRTGGCRRCRPGGTAQAMEQRLELEQYRSIEAFAMTLTHNICIDMWRCKRNDTLSLDIVQAASPTGTPERLLEIKDEIRLMHEIIDSLPNLQRTIMRMKDIEGYETDEIAEITGCGPEAIRSNLSRARKKVRDVYLRTIQERKERRNEP